MPETLGSFFEPLTLLLGYGFFAAALLLAAWEIYAYIYPFNKNKGD